MSSRIDFMHDFLAFIGIQTILIAVVLSIHTYIGLHVIRRGIIFSDLSLDQLAALGVIIGVGTGIDGGSIGSYVISFAAVAIGAVLLAVIKPKRGTIPREAVIGIIYCLALVASVLVADKISGGAAYVTQTMSGCMLWVTWPLVWVTVAAYILLGLFHYIYRDKIMNITEKKDTPHETFWDLLFFLSQGVITVLIVPIAGILLAYSFLMIPAAIALMFTRNWTVSLLLGWGLGFTACIIGLSLSYFCRLPYGPSLVLSLGAFFLAALILRTLLPERAGL